MPLSWYDRPADVKYQIDYSYNKISGHVSSRWGLYNGREEYRIVNVHDHLMIEKIVLKQLRRGQSHIVLMDIGAGDFQWGRGVAKFINGHPLFSHTVGASIFSLRGERSDGCQVIKDGVCTRYEYGNFKVENLFEELETRKHYLKDQVDLIVSDACFRHLVDATGTMLQAYYLLRPCTGMMCIEGFYLETSVCSHRGVENQYNLLSLFRSFNTPFFRMDSNPARRFDSFVIQKSEVPPSISLTYKNIIPSVDWSTGSNYVTLFEAGPEWRQQPAIYQHQSGGVTYSTITPEGDSLFKQIVVDHTTVCVAKRNKVAQLFYENNTKNFDSIHRLLKDLIEFDQQMVLDCIEHLISTNEQFAIRVLNHIPNKDHSLLRATLFSKDHIKYKFDNIPPLLSKLIEIASRDVLNEQLEGKTLMMAAVDFVVIANRTAPLKRLLLCPEVDLTIVSTKSGQTALDIVREERGKRQKQTLESLDSIRKVEFLLESATKK